MKALLIYQTEGSDLQIISHNLSSINNISIKMLESPLLKTQEGLFFEHEVKRNIQHFRIEFRFTALSAFQ